MDTANEQAILLHLQACDVNFAPPLSAKVNLAEYAAKITTNAVTFEAWNAEELVGVVAAYFNDGAKHKSFITNVSTLKAYGGKGIGSALIRDCIEYAVKEHYHSIALEVNKESTTAVRLYQKYGFKKVKENETALFMELKLNSSV